MRLMIHRGLLLPAVVALISVTGHGLSAQAPLRATTTSHPSLPGHPSLYWLVPDAATGRTSSAAPASAPARLARGVSLIRGNQFTDALPLVSTPALATTPLAAYARYCTGVAQLGANRH